MLDDVERSKVRVTRDFREPPQGRQLFYRQAGTGAVSPDLAAHVLQELALPIRHMAFPQDVIDAAVEISDFDLAQHKPALASPEGWQAKP